MDTYLDTVLFRDMLVESRLLSLEDLQFAENKAHVESKTLPHVLLELGLLSQKEITKIIALTQGVSFVDLSKKHITPESMSMIPEPISRTAGIVCFEHSDEHVGVACVDLSSVDKIQDMHDQKVVPYLTDSQSLKNTLKRYQKIQSETFGDQIISQIRNIRDPQSFKSIEEHIPHSYSVEIAEDLSTEKLMKSLLAHAHTARASHVYITPTDNEVVVSYRIGGVLYDAMNLPSSLLSSLVIKLRHMIDAPIVKPQSEPSVISGYTVREILGQDSSLQVLLFTTPHGTKAVVRILPEGTLFDPIESLVTVKTQQELLYSMLSNAKIILLTGPKKSGVSRTYYSLLEHASLGQKEVLSIEKPIEVILSRISQLASNSKKDSKKLFLEALQIRPDIVGLSPLDLAAHASIFPAVKSGIQAFLEIGVMQKFITILDNNKLLVPEIISSFDLIVSHAVFSSLDESEKKKKKLTQSEIAILTKYISEGECIALLAHEGVISQSTTRLADVSFTVRKKVSMKKRTSQERKKSFIRGVTTIQDVLRMCGTDSPTKVVLQKHMRVSQKRSVLENTLVKSIGGEICIKDICKYLNN